MTINLTLSPTMPKPLDIVNHSACVLPEHSLTKLSRHDHIPRWSFDILWYMNELRGAATSRNPSELEIPPHFRVGLRRLCTLSPFISRAHSEVQLLSKLTVAGPPKKGDRLMMYLSNGSGQLLISSNSLLEKSKTGYRGSYTYEGK